MVVIMEEKEDRRNTKVLQIEKEEENQRPTETVIKARVRQDCMGGKIYRNIVR